MKKSNCPTCGAQVIFRSAASIMAVCEYCRSTLVRRDADVENIGKMAELLEDASLIQLGAQGRYRGMHFAVVGRIQMQYAQGVWNEWHLFFDNGRSGWLSDGNGNYTVTFLAKTEAALPAFSQMSAGMSVKLNGEPFTVTDIETGTCIAGAGELMFKVGAGFAAPSVDLRSARNFASIDYSEDIPLLFMGAAVDFADLHLSNLRDAAQAGMGKTKLNALQCPSCAASIQIHTAGILRLTCPSCHALLDAENETLKLLKKFNANNKIIPFIPLGTEGTLGGTKFRVIGFLERAASADGLLYRWDEYLLHNPEQGFHWLSEYDGHWTYARPVNTAPTSSYVNGVRALLCNGRQYIHFEHSNAKVNYVAGEFYWRVSAGEKTRIDDYIDPPFILSEEKSGNEITWTEGEYLDAEVVRSAFGITRPMPAQRGVAPNQVWPRQDDYQTVWRSFWYASALLFFIQVGSLLWADNRSIFNETFEFPAGKSGVISSAEFDIPGHSGNLHLIQHTNIDNDWVALDVGLVARDSGRVYAVSREVAAYRGCDDGCWSEGSSSDDAMIANVPPGRYLMTVEAETSPTRQLPVTTRLEIQRNVSNWHNYFTIQFLLWLFPAIFWWRRATFEAERWSGSEHPRQSPGQKVKSALTQ